MRPYTAPVYRPVPLARVSLGQFSPFVNPFEEEGSPVAQPISPNGPQDGRVVKTALVLSGLALTAFSAATAYVGISYGMEKNRKPYQKILGWTVGVLGALSGLARLVATGTAVAMPSSLMGPQR